LKPTSSLVTALGALAIALGLFFIFAWTLKRAMPKGSAPLPGEVVELLGRAPLASRQYVHLLRVGNKLLLVSVSAAGAETLTEITDPIEVDRLAGICNQAQAGSTTMAFRQVFQQFSREPTSPGFADDSLAQPTDLVADGQTKEASLA
jgi:flagellar biogenesis protein FliO